ncbi:M17 family peptidase N-terminal domain-containing protein, partial [Nonomuraea longicatena]
MTTVRLNSADPVSFDTDALVVGFHPGPEGPRPAVDGLDAAFDGKLAASLTAVGFTGKAGESAKVPTFGAISAPLLVAVGLGDSPDAETLRRAAGAAVRGLAGTARAALALDGEAEAVALGGLLGAYDYSRYRTNGVRKAPVGELTVLAPA